MILDLISIQMTNPDIPIEDTTAVFIVTREGKPYTKEGIKYVHESLKNEFNITNDLSIYTGIGINAPKALAELLRITENPYVVLSYKDGIGFFPTSANKGICESLIKGNEKWPDMTSWQLLMKASETELY